MIPSVYTSKTNSINDMRILKIHSTLLIFLLLLFYENGTHARFSFKAAMKKIGSLAKAVASTALTMATKSLPIPLSLLPGGAQLQKALGPGISVGGVDLAAAAADPKAAVKQIALKEAQKATGVDIQGVSQMTEGRDFGQMAAVGAKIRPKMGPGTRMTRPPMTGRALSQEEPVRGQRQPLGPLFRPPTMSRALSLPLFRSIPQPPMYPQQPQYPQPAPQYAPQQQQQQFQGGYAPQPPQPMQQQQQPIQAYAPPPQPPPYASPEPVQYYNNPVPPFQQQPMQQQMEPVYANPQQQQQQPMVYAQ